MWQPYRIEEVTDLPDSNTYPRPRPGVKRFFFFLQSVPLDPHK